LKKLKKKFWKIKFKFCEKKIIFLKCKNGENCGAAQRKLIFKKKKILRKIIFKKFAEKN